MDKNSLASKSADISKWYTQVVLSSKLADYAPVKGCMVIRPYGYAIWERVTELFNTMIKKGGVENAYFPLFIPNDLLQKEKEHVDGFSPELAVVTIGGGKKLSQPLVVRPTSETIIYQMFSKWISSWRDLPLKINQWCNIVRWELRTYLFLRTTEFLWQEGHTAHTSESEAREMTMQAFDWYKQIYQNYCAMCPISGIKSQTEKFAGAKETYAVEFLMPDGKALQGATSHLLGQNFSRAFDITYQTKTGKTEHVWQTSWGLSTRSIGGLVLSHGDDSGLILPPMLAPVKAVILPIFGKNNSGVVELCFKIKKELDQSDSEFHGSVVVDEDSEKSFGFRINQWQLKGVPLVIPVGEKELEKDGIFTLKPRIKDLETVKTIFPKLVITVEATLREIQNRLLQNNKEFTQKNTYTAKTYSEFKNIMSTTRGFIKAFWCGGADCEAKIKSETKATTRVLPASNKPQQGKCVYCGKAAQQMWYFAQSY